MKFNLVEGESHNSKYNRFVECYNSNKSWKEIDKEFTKQMSLKLYTEAIKNKDIKARL